MFRNFGPVEILIILAVVLLLFGATKLPQIGRSLGSGLREFKNGISGHGEEEKSKNRQAGNADTNASTTVSNNGASASNERHGAQRH